MQRSNSTSSCRASRHEQEALAAGLQAACGGEGSEGRAREVNRNERSEGGACSSTRITMIGSVPDVGTCSLLCLESGQGRADWSTLAACWRPDEQARGGLRTGESTVQCFTSSKRSRSSRMQGRQIQMCNNFQSGPDVTRDSRVGLSAPF